MPLNVCVETDVKRWVVLIVDTSELFPLLWIQYAVYVCFIKSTYPCHEVLGCVKMQIKFYPVKSGCSVINRRRKASSGIVLLSRSSAGKSLQKQCTHTFKKMYHLAEFNCRWVSLFLLCRLSCYSMRECEVIVWSSSSSSLLFKGAACFFLNEGRIVVLPMKILSCWQGVLFTKYSPVCKKDAAVTQRGKLRRKGFTCEGWIGPTPLWAPSIGSNPKKPTTLMSKSISGAISVWMPSGCVNQK